MRLFSFTVLFFTVFLLSGYSQSGKPAKKLGISPQTVAGDSVRMSDSLLIEKLTEQVEQLKQNEILHQEMIAGYEQSREADLQASSHRREHIDSLRNIAKGRPVVIDEDTLFSIYPVRGGNSYITRASNAISVIKMLGSTWGVKPDSISCFTSDGYAEIMYNDKTILFLSEYDALWMHMPLDSLAGAYKEKIVEKVKELQHKNSLKYLVMRIIEFIVAFVGLILLIRGLNNLLKKWKGYVKKYFELRFSPLIIRKYKILDESQALTILFIAMDVLRYVIILIAFVIAFPIIFFIFPQTRDFAETLFAHIITPTKFIITSIIDYIPDLIIIILIWLLIHYVIKGLRYISKEISTGRLKISGFYADWAIPTFNLVRFILYIFLIALIYPYLPGSSSNAFKGISVLVGLIFSFGSTAVIGNIIAGLVITYMRPFKLGDMIKLNDTIGAVIEKTPFVTRIRTLKNEIITIPNSFMLSSQTTNYTASADSYGLIIHTSIGVSYSVPNKHVHELLIKAARMTEGVLKDREPFVLDKKFEDLYQEYEINAYITNVNAINKIYSALHYHIQNTFIEAGIELQVPFVVSGIGPAANDTVTKNK